MPRVPDQFHSRCPIHGNIVFNDREKALIAHPFCQRLRHISQLGFASYVYMGATHHRLGHSMGVMHLAGRIFDRICTREQSWLSQSFSSEQLQYYRQVLRFAALLHDIGHAPFSHSAESILPSIQQLPLPHTWYDWHDSGHAPSPETQATHEDFTIAIIHYLAQEAPHLLSLEEAQDVCSLIDKRILVSSRFTDKVDSSLNMHPFLKSLISGEIDVDRMDYLHRDSHYTGVNYGKFDLDRIIRALGCTSTPDGIALTLDHDTVYSYENYLLARFHMFMQVYFHKTTLPFDYYLKRSFLENELDFKITGSLDEYLGIRDEQIEVALWNARHQKWASKIVNRQPSKRLFQFEHYHPPELEQKMEDALNQAQIPFLKLESHAYLSVFDHEPSSRHPALLIRHEALGQVTHFPIQQASKLLEQYRPMVNIRYLYCEPCDYEQAAQKLRPVLSSLTTFNPAAS